MKTMIGLSADFVSWMAGDSPAASPAGLVDMATAAHGAGPYCVGIDPDGRSIYADRSELLVGAERLLAHERGDRLPADGGEQAGWSLLPGMAGYPPF